MPIELPKDDEVPVIREQDVFRPGENVFIQTSGKHREFLGVVHKHTFIELVYVISGNATHLVGERTFPATKGDLFIINYNTPHAFFRNTDNDEPFIVYDLLCWTTFVSNPSTRRFCSTLCSPNPRKVLTYTFPAPATTASATCSARSIRSLHTGKTAIWT